MNAEGALAASTFSLDDHPKLIVDYIAILTSVGTKDNLLAMVQIQTMMILAKKFVAKTMQKWQMIASSDGPYLFFCSQ
jgi:hypothetical protein